MAKLFNTRELFYKYPWLAKLRHNFLVGFCNYGTRSLYATHRFIRVVSPEAAPILDSQQPVIWALYHGCMVGLMDLPKRDKITILVSSSRDGDMIAAAAEGMGFQTARGSSARGGVRALIEMRAAARAGNSLAMLVDGPKGPRHEIKGGVIKLAQLTGLPIMPIGLAARSGWWPNSWDRYCAPAYGSPVVTVFGEPMYVPSDASEQLQEEKRLQLERRMKELHALAEPPIHFSDARRAGNCPPADVAS